MKSKNFGQMALNWIWLALSRSTSSHVDVFFFFFQGEIYKYSANIAHKQLDFNHSKMDQIISSACQLPIFASREDRAEQVKSLLLRNRRAQK